MCRVDKRKGHWVMQFTNDEEFAEAYSHCKPIVENILMKFSSLYID
jgi:hypothetical protein